MARMGRPRAFDRDDAVDQAMQLFWQHGYDSTSLALLKAELGGGISAPSFYAAFGSKEALFDECVQRYLATFAQVTECLWDETLPPRQAIETALRQSARIVQRVDDAGMAVQYAADEASRAGFGRGLACVEHARAGIAEDVANRLDLGRQAGEHMGVVGAAQIAGLGEAGGDAMLLDVSPDPVHRVMTELVHALGRVDAMARRHVA